MHRDNLKHQKTFAVMSNLQTNCRLKLSSNFHKVDKQTRCINGTKRHKDNQWQKLNSPVEYPKREYKFDIKESEW